MLVQDYVRDLAIEAGSKPGNATVAEQRDTWRPYKHKHMFPVWRRGGVRAAYADLLGVVLWQDIFIAPLTILLHAPLACALRLQWGWGDAALEALVSSGAVPGGGWGERGLGWLLAAVEFVARGAVIVVLDEAWIYVGHRFLHWPGVYEAVHQFHHHTTQTSISANATHPVESAIIGAPILLSVCHVMDMPLWLRVLAAVFGYTLNLRLHAGWIEDDGGGGATLHHQIHHWKIRSAYGLQEWSDRLVGSVPLNSGLFAPLGTRARTQAEAKKRAEQHVTAE